MSRADDPKWIEVEGDKPKVAASQQHFAELRASLKNAADVERDLRADYERALAVVRALETIAKTCDWYANNPHRDAMEVDHCICVEIPHIAETALDAFEAGA